MRLPLWPPMHVVGFRGDLRRVARRDNLSIILRMRTSSQWLAHTFFATTLPERVTALSPPPEQDIVPNAHLNPSAPCAVCRSDDRSGVGPVPKCM